MFTLWLEYFIYLFFSSPSPFLPVTPLLLRHFFFLSPPSSTCRRPKPLPSADRLKPTPPSASDPHRQSPPILWIEVASLNSTSLLGHDCAPVFLVSGLRSMCGLNVWVAGFGFGGFRRLGCWISGVTVEMVVVVGHIDVGSICDL